MPSHETTKITKITKITKTALHKRLFVAFVAFVVFMIFVIELRHVFRTVRFSILFSYLSPFRMYRTKIPGVTT